MNRWVGPFFRLLASEVKQSLRSSGFRLGAILVVSTLSLLVYGVHQQRAASPLARAMWGQGDQLEQELSGWPASQSNPDRKVPLRDLHVLQAWQGAEAAVEEVSARRAAAQWAGVQVAVAPESLAPKDGLEGLNAARIPWATHDAAWVERQWGKDPGAEIGLLTWEPAAERPGGGRWRLAGTLSDAHAEAITEALRSDAQAQVWRQQNPFPEGPIGTVRTRVWAYPTEAATEAGLLRLLTFLIGVPVVMGLFIAGAAGTRVSSDIVSSGHWEAWVGVPMPTGCIILAAALAPNLVLLGGLLACFLVVAAILPAPFLTMMVYLLPWWLGMAWVLPSMTLLSMSAVFWSTHPWWHHRGGMAVSATMSMLVVQGAMRATFGGALDWTMPGFTPLSEWAWRHGQVPLHPVWSVLGVSGLSAAVIGLGSWALIVRGTGRRRQGWLSHHR